MRGLLDDCQSVLTIHVGISDIPNTSSANAFTIAYNHNEAFEASAIIA